MFQFFNGRTIKTGGPAIKEKNELFFRRPLSSRGGGVKALMARPLKENSFYLRLPKFGTDCENYSGFDEENPLTLKKLFRMSNVQLWNSAFYRKHIHIKR